MLIRGERPTPVPPSGKRRVSIDDWLAENEPDPRMPRSGRPPTLAESWAAENPGATSAERRAMADLQRTLGQVLPGLVAGPLSSSSREGDPVSMDPASFRMGAPRGRAPRSSGSSQPRPLRESVDFWLTAGGWGGGKERAGSLTLAGPDSEEARNRIRDQWRWELRCRGWEGDRWITRRWYVEAGVARMYWWTTDKAPEVPPPAPPEG